MAIKIIPNPKTSYTRGKTARPARASSTDPDDARRNNPPPENTAQAPSIKLDVDRDGILNLALHEPSAGNGNGKWTWQQRRFQQWCALPKAVRPPNLRTQNQVAKALGTNAVSLTEWKRKEGWWEAVYGEALCIIGDDLGDIIRAQVDEAKIGSTRAAIFCMKMLGVFREEAPALRAQIEPLTIVLSPDVKKFQELSGAALASPTAPGIPTQLGPYVRGKDVTPDDNTEPIIIDLDPGEYRDADAEIHSESEAEPLYSL